jgi:hypothetical protein
MLKHPQDSNVLTVAKIDIIINDTSVYRMFDACQHT